MEYADAVGTSSSRCLTSTFRGRWAASVPRQKPCWMCDVMDFFFFFRGKKKGGGGGTVGHILVPWLATSITSNVREKEALARVLRVVWYHAATGVVCDVSVRARVRPLAFFLEALQKQVDGFRILLCREGIFLAIGVTAMLCSTPNRARCTRPLCSARTGELLCCYLPGGLPDLLMWSEMLHSN